MFHSHMPVQHLIRQIELRKQEQEKRRALPSWMTTFIDNIADAMEPVSGVARLGFDCRITEEGWMLALFLGSTEIIGGKDDGCSKVPNFDVDIMMISNHLDSVESICWESRPTVREEDTTAFHSEVTIRGTLENKELTLSILDRAPDNVGPGMRAYMNGQMETV